MCFLKSPSETRSKTATSMHSAILGCERSTYPVLLHCLQNLSHDVRRLQLVNKSMCAACRHFKDQVDEHTAKRQKMLVEANALDVVARLHLAMSSLRMQPASQSQSMTEMWTAFERFASPAYPAPVPAIEPRIEPRMVFSVHHIYQNNIFDDSFNDCFVRGFRLFDPAQFATAAAVHTAVIEVD